METAEHPISFEDWLKLNRKDKESFFWHEYHFNPYVDYVYNLFKKDTKRLRESISIMELQLTDDYCSSPQLTLLEIKYRVFTEVLFRIDLEIKQKLSEKVSYINKYQLQLF